MAEWMEVVVAILPIAIILILMIWKNWSATRAGLVGLLATIIGVLTAFPLANNTESPGHQFFHFVAIFAEAGFVAATILWIIFGALCVYHLQGLTGAFDILKRALGVLSDNPLIIAILISWFFTLFMEGAAGFGTPVALAAPFLVGFGFSPVQAVTMALVGHCVGVSFGAVGTPIIAQLTMLEFSATEIAQSAAIYHLILGTLMLMTVVYLAQPSTKKNIIQLPWPWIISAAILFLAPMYVIATLVGPELPTLGGALIGGLLFVVFLRFKSSSETRPESPSRFEIIAAALPYIVVILLIVLTRLIPVLNEIATGVVWEWRILDQYQGRFQPLYHPGTILMVGFFASAMLPTCKQPHVKMAILDAWKALLKVSVALFAMLAISRLMVHSAMIVTLAETAAQLAGETWPLWAPFVGALGSFITGSATASNILFTEFQVATSLQTMAPTLNVVGAQGFGAAVGNIISPHNIIAGCATVGIANHEGVVLRKTLPICLGYTLLGGLMGLVIFTAR